MNPIEINRKELIKKFDLDLSKNLNMISKREVEEIEKEEKYESEIEKINLNKTIRNSTEILSLKIKAVLPVNFREKRLIEKDKPINYMYKLDTILNTNIINIYSKKLIHLCIFNIIEKRRPPYIGRPILLYLLNKDSKTNKLYYPHFYTNTNIFDKAKENLDIIFKDWDKLPELKGYIETTNNIYIYYEQKYPYLLEKLEYKDSWWWGSIWEILDVKTILNFTIDKSVYEIFYKNPLLFSLFDNNNKLEIPYIGYFGAYATYISFIATFGLPKQLPDSNLGPYYYFYTYYGAGRGAIWTQNRRSQVVNNEDITLDEYGLHKRGGIVRFAIFGNKIKYFLNRETDPDDDSIISQELAKDVKKKFYKSTLKIRDVDGKWADNYDLAYIGSVLIKDAGGKGDRILNIQFAARDFYQQVPLTYHYVDTEEFSKITNHEERINKPYTYKDYNIE